MYNEEGVYEPYVVEYGSDDDLDDINRDDA